MIWAAVIIILSGDANYEAYVPMFNSEESCLFFIDWQRSLVEAVAPDATFDARCESSA